LPSSERRCAGARLLAIAAVLEGASREEAAKIGGMDRQTLRDWVIRFNDGQYRHGEGTKAAVAEQRKFSALLKMLRAGLT
jgi:transposase-like protein